MRSKYSAIVRRLNFVRSGYDTNGMEEGVEIVFGLAEVELFSPLHWELERSCNTAEFWVL